MQSLQGLRLTVISPQPFAIYTGMIPGVIAGDYRIEEAQVDVQSLTGRAGGCFVQDRVVAIEADNRRLLFEERPPLSYDLVSFDIGSQTLSPKNVEEGAAVIPVRPIESALPKLIEKLEDPATRTILIVGAGAGGVELAFAVASRLPEQRQGSVLICDRNAEPISGRGDATSEKVRRAFEQRCVQFLGNRQVQSVDREGVLFSDGERMGTDVIVLAAGATGHELFASSTIATDSRNCIIVDDFLRSTSHPDIFAAGDCATMSSHPDLPKAGVYAVRQGPILATNLRRTLAKPTAKLKTFRPQKGFLALLNTGDRRAILSYRGRTNHSRSAWRLKDGIDRRFIRQYQRPDLGTKMDREMIPCGGCSAKVSRDILANVLSRIDIPDADNVIVGLRAADDAAIVRHASGDGTVSTVDLFPPFSDDLYLVGQVAANNAASDLFAMGAIGESATAIVSLNDQEMRSEEQLEHFLSGAARKLRELEVPLVGGHTVAGEQVLLGFAMNGRINPDKALIKSAAKPGDVIVLSKALGTGIILAAARMGMADASWVTEAHRSMLQSNRSTAEILVNCGVKACTDVSGFGLIGHLLEILQASNVVAKLDADRIPILSGCRELADAGWQSSFHERNWAGLGGIEFPNVDPTIAKICFDPQTSGGLLGCIPAENTSQVLDSLSAKGVSTFAIGEITASSDERGLEKRILFH